MTSEHLTDKHTETINNHFPEILCSPNAIIFAKIIKFSIFLLENLPRNHEYSALFNTSKRRLALHNNTIPFTEQFDLKIYLYIFFAAYKSDVPCDFCSQRFGSTADKNAHILDHFEQQICQKCDQNLLRIGDNFYILHATLTCISGSVIKQETESDEPNDNGICSIQVHSIDAKQFEINRDFNEQNSVIIKHESNETIGNNVPPFENQSASKSKRTKEKYPCGYDGCDATFSATKNRKLHMARKHADKCFECSECEKVFSTNCQLRRHMLSHDVQMKFSCGKCGLTDLSERSFKRLHQNPKFVCRKCNVTFCKFTQLNNHICANSNEVIDVGSGMLIEPVEMRQTVKKIQFPASQSVDEKTNDEHYENSGQIQQHMISHSTQKKYNCSKCGSTDLTKGSFNRHHLTPNLMCHECGVTYCKFSQLKDHYKQHTGANPYDGIDLSAKLSVKEISAQKREKKYQCSFDGCNELVSSTSRRMHLASKHKLVQLECDLCKKTFTSISR